MKCNNCEKVVPEEDMVHAQEENAYYCHPCRKKLGMGPNHDLLIKETVDYQGDVK